MLPSRSRRGRRDPAGCGGIASNGHWYVPYNGGRARDKGPTFLDPHSRGADRRCRTRGMSRGRGWHDRLWAHAGITITHDWGLARRTASRMLVMLKGEVVADGPIERVCFDPDRTGHAAPEDHGLRRPAPQPTSWCPPSPLSEAFRPLPRAPRAASLLARGHRPGAGQVESRPRRLAVPDPLALGPPAAPGLLDLE